MKNIIMLKTILYASLTVFIVATQATAQTALPPVMDTEKTLTSDQNKPGTNQAVPNLDNQPTSSVPPQTSTPTQNEVESALKNVSSLVGKVRVIYDNYNNDSPFHQAINTTLIDIISLPRNDQIHRLNRLLIDFDEDENDPAYEALQTILNQEKPIDYYIESSLPCKPTPTVTPSFILLDAAVKNNNLIRKTGALYRAKGQYVRIEGQVRDQQCLPVSNAVVTIWQTDRVGKHQAQYTLFDQWTLRDPDYDPNFAFSGVAQTDNLGHFSFLTIFPGVSEDNPSTAPHINIRIAHPEFQELDSRIYFSQHPKNTTDTKLQELNADDAIRRPDMRQRVTAIGQPIDPNGYLEGRMYFYDATLTGIDTYISF